MNEMKENTAYISTAKLAEFIKAAIEGEIYAAKAEELENEVLELKAKLAEYGKVDQWFTATPWNYDLYKDWATKQGIDDQAIEIERLQGENEELRRGMDELGAQVEYWRLKAGAADE